MKYSIILILPCILAASDQLPGLITGNTFTWNFSADSEFNSEFNKDETENDTINLDRKSQSNNQKQKKTVRFNVSKGPDHSTQYDKVKKRVFKLEHTLSEEDEESFSDQSTQETCQESKEQSDKEQINTLLNELNITEAQKFNPTTVAANHILHTTANKVTPTVEYCGCSTSSEKKTQEKTNRTGNKRFSFLPKISSKLKKGNKA